MHTIVTVTEESPGEDLIDRLSSLKPTSLKLFAELKRSMDSNNVAERPPCETTHQIDYTKRLVNILRNKGLIRHCPTIAFTNDPHLTYPRHSVMLNPYLLIPVDAEQVQEYWDLLKDIKK